MVKEELIDWLLENDKDTLIEEGEDILDGLEMKKSKWIISRRMKQMISLAFQQA